MAIHHFRPDSYCGEIGGHAPVLRVEPGDTVVTSTVDAHGLNENLEEVAPRGNPLTGPFYVEGVGAGDALAVHIENIIPNRSSAWSRVFISGNVVEPELVKHLPERQYAQWRIDVEKGSITLLEPELKNGTLILSLAPMIGCIGVSPPDGRAIPSITSGPGGGNMDYFMLRAGTTILFPVFNEGALLYLGDVHALQGEGEPAGSGVEVSADLQFTVDMVKGEYLRWPRGETRQFIFAIGSAKSLIRALRHATTEMIRMLEERYDLGLSASSLIIGQGACYDIASATNPACTVSCRVSKRSLVPFRM